MLKKLQQIKTPKILKPLFGNLLLKREPDYDKPMDFPVGEGLTEEEKEATETPLKLTPISARPLTTMEKGKEQIGKLSDVFYSGYEGVKSEFLKDLEKGYQHTSDELFEDLSTTEKAKAVGQEFIYQFPRKFSSATVGTLSAVSGAIGYAERFGWDKAKPIADKLDEWSEKISAENPDTEVIDMVMSGAGSMLTFYLPGFGVARGTKMLTGISPRIANIFGNSAMVFLESSMEAGGVYRDLMKQGVSEEIAKKRADIDFGINVILIGLTNRFNFVGNKKMSIVREIKNRLLAGGREAVQELGQQVAGNIATYKDWEEGTKEAFGVGGIMGFMFGGSVNPNINIDTQKQKEILDIIRENANKIPVGLTIEDISKKEILEESQPEATKFAQKGVFKPITAEKGIIPKELEPLYHGTSADIIGGKLSFGKGQIRKGGQSGGLFLTDTKQSAQVFGKNVYKASPEIKKQVIDLTTPTGIKIIKNYIGKSYKTFDGEIVKFTKQDFDLMFPKGKTDFASISQYPELIAKIVKDNKKKGIAFEEFAGGKIGKTYQILEGDIPITQATKAVKAVEPKLLTTPEVRGEGFITREISKKRLSPEIQAKREIAKYRKEMAEKKITEPLIARINKIKIEERATAEGKIFKIKTAKDILDKRQKIVKTVRDYFGLTDAEIKSISRKDVRLMSNFEFKNFIDDFRVKAEEFALKKQIVTENVAAGYKPTAELVKPEAVPQEALSGFDNFIDLTKIKRKDIPHKDMDIAELVKDDKTFPAIRESGFFATKDIQTAFVRDIYNQSLSPHLMALKQDAYKLGGEFGIIFKKIWKPTEKAIRNEKEFNVEYVKKIKELGKKYNIEPSKNNLEHLSDVIEKKVKATPNEEAYTKELRVVLDNLRNQANEVREIMGKKKIGYIENYLSHIQKATLWNELLSNEATISDNLDFIIPNQTKNPFSYKRMMEIMPEAERNLYILLDRYVAVIGKDIYITPAIENIKAYNNVLKNREKIRASQYWDEYIRTGLVGKQHKLDTALSIGQKGRKVLVRWNNMVNLAFLTGKVAWNIATQPLSFMMPGISEVSVINSVKAIYKSFHKPLREYVAENSDVLAIKSGDVRAIAIGEGRNIQNRIYRTKIDKYNDMISMIGSIEERALTMASYVAGLERAKNLGYKGQDALWFADLVAAKSQSMYNRENRALILNSDIARTMFPFQSFSVEIFNHLKEIGTKEGGAMRLTYRQRLGKLFGLLVGLYMANWYSEKLTGRKKTTLGTFFPYVGSWVDILYAKAIGKEYYGGRSPITVIQIADDIVKGSKDFIEHGNIKKLRKVGVNFGLALGGIGGGGQINNLIDGIMINIDGDVKNVSGKTMFSVEDTLSKVIAPIFGVWATMEGREYWLPKEEKTKKTSFSEWKKKQETKKIPTFQEWKKRK